MAPQIEIDGQDYSDNDDGSEDEDQNTILDDPAEKREKRGSGLPAERKSKTHKTATSLCADVRESSQAFLFTPGLQTWCPRGG